MKAFSNLLRRSPFYGGLKTLGHYPDYLYWRLRGQPLRSPHLLKQRTVHEYAQRFGLCILIETGTYYGEMIAAMRPYFDRIDSIEQNPELAQRAVKRFARSPKIHIHQGDSQRVLPELLATLTQPALFWLDAGYYGWAGMQGAQQRLGVELEAILGHQVGGHIILMDDARGLNGENGSLTVAVLTQRIADEFPGHNVEVAYDILRITPNL